MTERKTSIAIMIKSKVIFGVLITLLFTLIPGLVFHRNNVKATISYTDFRFYGENHTVVELLGNTEFDNENMIFTSFNEDPLNFYITPDDGYRIVDVVVESEYNDVSIVNVTNQGSSCNINYPGTSSIGIFEYDITVVTEVALDWSKALVTEWTIPVDVDGTGNGTTIMLPVILDSYDSMVKMLHIIPKKNSQLIIIKIQK